MIVWSGLGFLVALFVFGAALLCNIVFDAGFGAGYFTAHDWTLGIAMLIAAAASAAVGRPLRARGERVLVDPQNGQRVVLRRSHTMFWIAIDRWAYVLGAIGIVLIAMEVVR